MTDHSGSRGNAGFTLTELMVAMTVSLVLMAGLGGMLLQSSGNNRQDINVSRMLDDLGYAMSLLNNDLEMAGFWARVHDPGYIQRDASLTVAADCGAGAAAWVYGELIALRMLDNATGAAAHAAHDCLVAADVVDGADVIAVKRVRGRVSGTDTDASGLVTGRVYLRTNGLAGALYLRGGTPPAMPVPFEEWEYEASVYYVQKYSVAPDERPAVPSLCRMALAGNGGGAPAFRRECLAQGVENLQVEVGVDSDGNGVANYFSTAPGDDELRRAVAARVYLLVRSSQPDARYENGKTYLIGNADPFTPVDAAGKFYRKTLATEVVLRNPRTLEGVAVP